MYLKRSITVNWGNLPPQEFDYGPVNLFSGGNGSGKTTAADALQTLMTAAHDNLFNYNPGQDETTQRGRGGKQVRTLASYILGCDDGAFARPWDSDGYIAGVFEPTKGESCEPFTAVIGVRAHLDRAGSSPQARQDELLMMIVAGERLSLSHFLRHYADGRHVVPVTELATLLRQEFGKKAVEIYDKKSAYLARLYGALRGKSDAVSTREAKNAARAFASFMAYKPVRSIDQFVAEEVLEARDLGDTIRRIRDLLRTVHGMEQEASRIRASAVQLELARDGADRYLEHWLERTALAYGAAAGQYRHNQRDYLAAKEEQLRLNGELASLDEDKRLGRERLDQAHRDLIALEARRQGIAALHTKDDLERQRDGLNEQLHQGVPPLLEQDHQRESNLTALRNIRDALARHDLDKALPELAGRSWRADSAALLDGGDQRLPDLNQLLARDWIDLSPLDSALDRLRADQQIHNRLVEQLHASPAGDDQAPSPARRLQLLVSDREKALADLQRRLNQSEQQIAALEAHKITYPADVQAALAAIRQQCPGADPRVLCDHVEVMDPEWQMAIEGYIGGGRFAILVEPAFEAEAIRVVRRLGGRERNRARVIQGDQARRDTEKQTLPADSIIHALRFSHRTAEHYLRASYGNVVRVADAEALRRTRRGITADGMGSGNYTLFRCDIDDSQLVFGETARERNLQAQRLAQRELRGHYESANRDYQAARQLAEQVERLKPLAQAAAVAGLLDIQRRLREVEEQLERLDLSAHQDLEQEQQRLRGHYQTLEEHQRQLNEENGRLGALLKELDQRIRRFADTSDQLRERQERAEAALLDAADHWPGLDIERYTTAMDERLRQAHASIDFETEEKELSSQLTREAIALERAILEYNRQALVADSLVADSPAELHSLAFFGHVRNLRQQLDGLHNRLRNNVLLEKQERLAALRDTFNTTFVSDLCHEIHQAINDGKRILDNLNSELQHHHFGADRERFEFEWAWVPEFKEYWDFFREIIRIPNLGDGTSLFDDSLGAKAAAVRDRMLALLLDGDEQLALRELERISDYRHYRRYDILKHPEGKAPIRLSEYGTGSGGQLETPAYIIRAAAITSAFRFNEGNSHLRMVIVDEAFMHMDETRSREIIGYLTQTIGLQLVFIMPTSKAGPFLDLVSNQFVFSKVPSPMPLGELNTRVLVDRQQLNRDQVAELWANHRRVIRHQGAMDFMEGL